MPTLLTLIILGRARIARVVIWTSILGFLVTVAYLASPAPIKTATHHPHPSIMAAATTLKYLTVPAIGKHTATVLFVHVRTCLPIWVQSTRS